MLGKANFPPEPEGGSAAEKPLSTLKTPAEKFCQFLLCAGAVPCAAVCL